MSTFEHYREEADRLCPHMTPDEKDSWARHNVKHHPGFVADHTKGRPTMRVQVREDRVVKLMLMAILLLLFLMVAHEHGWCQNRSNNLIQFQQAGTPVATVPTPVIMNFQSGCTVATIAGGVSLTCSGGGGGGSTLISTNGVNNTDQTTLNFQNTTYITWTNPSFGNVRATLGNPPSTILGDFSTTAPTTTGQVPIYDSTVPNAAGGTGAYVPGDPKVQGTQAAASASQPNPVMGGVWDGTNLRALLGDSSGRQIVNINGTVPISAASLPLPTNAATDRTTAAAPFATELSDGAAFYTAAKTGQLPTALDGSGFLKVHEQGTAAVSWSAQTVTVTQGTGTNLHAVLDSGTTTVTQATGSNLHVVVDTAPTTAVTESGTWTVQPGNTANTTPWLTTDSATSATGAAPPAKAAFTGFLGSGATGGFLTGAPVGDTYKNVNISTATTTLLVTGVAGRQVRINAMHLVTAAANNVALIEGTGATCGTGSAGLAGGTTAASGYNLAANGGLAFGSGLGAIMQTATTGDSVCVVTSAATQLSGGLEYTIY